MFSVGTRYNCGTTEFFLYLWLCNPPKAFTTISGLECQKMPTKEPYCKNQDVRKKPDSLIQCPRSSSIAPSPIKATQLRALILYSFRCFLLLLFDQLMLCICILDLCLQEYCFWPKQGRAYMTQNKDPISQFVVWGFLFVLKQNNH